MHHQQLQSWIQKNYLSFNGLRALAIGSVFLCHYGPVAFPAHLHAGLWWVGVDVFFVLSGFLITGILYSSRASEHYFYDFFVRRALRILPVYWGLLTILTAFSYISKAGRTRLLSFDFLFLQNLMYRSIYFHRWTFAPTGIHMKYGAIGLGALWSLCVEEQFYALWPFVLRYVPSREKLFRLALFGAVCVLILRCSLYFLDHTAAVISNYLYVQPYTRFDSLLIGAALNLWLQHERLSRSELRRISLRLFLLGTLSLIASLIVFGRDYPLDDRNPVIQTVGFTLVAIAAAGLLMRTLDDASRLSGFLRLKWLQHLGVVSFGFYLFHELFRITITSATNAVPHMLRPLVVLAVFPAVWVISWLSYHYWESPFLRLKGRLAPSHRSIPSGRDAMIL